MSDKQQLVRVFTRERPKDPKTGRGPSAKILRSTEQYVQRQLEGRLNPMLDSSVEPKPDQAPPDAELDVVGGMRAQEIAGDALEAENKRLDDEAAAGSAEVPAPLSSRALKALRGFVAHGWYITCRAYFDSVIPGGGDRKPPL